MSADVHRINNIPQTASMVLAMAASHEPQSVVVSIIDKDGTQHTFMSQMRTETTCRHMVLMNHDLNKWINEY